MLRFLRFFYSARADLSNVLSLLIFFAVTALLFRSVQFSLIVTASLGFHELGHAAALTLCGVDWRIRFGPAGASTWSPAAVRARLSHLQNAVIHLAGPLFSLVLAIAAYGLHLIWQPASDHLLLLANFSAQVCFLNMLPFGPMTDGGKIVRRLALSFQEPVRAWLLLPPMLISALLLVLYSAAGQLAYRDPSPTPLLLAIMLIGMWMACSLIIEWLVHLPGHMRVRSSAERLVPVTGAARENITPLQGVILVMSVWALMALATLLSAITPFWLAPQFLLGTLRNVTDFLHFLARSFS